MFLSFIALILTILVFVQACKKENRTDLSGTYEIGLQQTKKITTNNSITAIKLTNINESKYLVLLHFIFRLLYPLISLIIYLILVSLCKYQKNFFKDGYLYVGIFKKITPLKLSIQFLK